MSITIHISGDENYVLDADIGRFSNIFTSNPFTATPLAVLRVHLEIIESITTHVSDPENYVLDADIGSFNIIFMSPLHSHIHKGAKGAF